MQTAGAVLNSMIIATTLTRYILNEHTLDYLHRNSEAQPHLMSSPGGRLNIITVLPG